MQAASWGARPAVRNTLHDHSQGRFHSVQSLSTVCGVYSRKIQSKRYICSRQRIPRDMAALGAQGHPPSAKEGPTMGSTTQQTCALQGTEPRSTGLSSRDLKTDCINNGNSIMSKVTLQVCRGTCLPLGGLKQLHLANWAAQLKFLWEHA